MNNDNVTQESLNMFMLGLVKVQGGSSPLLPNYDTLYIDAQKAQRAIEYIFAQARSLQAQRYCLLLPHPTNTSSHCCIGLSRQAFHCVCL